MAKNRPRKPAYRAPKYPIITQAISGDVDAINQILQHYDRYISVLSTRTLYDDAGMPHVCIDEELKRRLETKLITKIIGFKV